MQVCKQYVLAHGWLSKVSLHLRDAVLENVEEPLASHREVFVLSMVKSIRTPAEHPCPFPRAYDSQSIPVREYTIRFARHPCPNPNIVFFASIPFLKQACPNPNIISLLSESIQFPEHHCTSSEHKIPTASMPRHKTSSSENI